MATQRNKSNNGNNAPATVVAAEDREESLHCTTCNGQGIVEVEDGMTDCKACGGRGVAGNDEVQGGEGTTTSEYSPSGNTKEGSDQEIENEGMTVVGVMVRLDDDAEVKQADGALADLIQTARSLRQEHRQRGNTYSRIFVDNVVGAIERFDRIVTPCTTCNGTGAVVARELDKDGNDVPVTDGRTVNCYVCDGDGIGLTVR
jgi:hypothetical protein